MSQARAIRLRAFVGPTEARAVDDAVQRLCEGLASAAPPGPRVSVEFVASPGELPDQTGDAILISSLGPEVEAAVRDWPSAEMRLKRDYEALARRGPETLFLCTVFRHVPAELDDEARISLRLAIRRLDLLAVQLSHATGLNLIDLDRALADAGALALDTDYRLGGTAGAKAAGREIARAILTAGLDAWIAPEIQERAAAALGPA